MNINLNVENSYYTNIPFAGIMGVEISNYNFTASNVQIVFISGAKEEILDLHNGMGFQTITWVIKDGLFNELSFRFKATEIQKSVSFDIKMITDKSQLPFCYQEI